MMRFVRLFIFSFASVLSFFSFIFPLFISPVLAIDLKVDRVTINTNTGIPGSWAKVSFSESFNSVPVVFSMPTSDNSDPTTVRIRNVTVDGFEMLVVEPEGSDGSTDAMTVDYFAIPPGLYRSSAGRILLEVVTLSTANQQGKFINATASDSVSFSGDYSDPVIITQIQTTNSQPTLDAGQVASPWLEVAVSDLTSEGMDIALELSETSSGTVVAEEIAYMIMESDAFVTATINNQTLTFRAVATNNFLDSTCRTVNFPAAFSGTPLVFASQNSRNDDDGGWVRRCSLSSSSVGLFVDEDDAGDAERSHNRDEQAGVIALSGSFSSSIIAAGQITIQEGVYTQDWTTISFPNAFDETPVVFSLMTNDEPDPSALRIRNVSVDGFDIAAFKPENESDASVATTVDYVAVVPGEYVLPNGDQFEVGSLLTDKVQGSVGATGWDTQTFLSSFSSAPALLAQIQTINNESALVPSLPSIPWLVPAVDNLSSTSFDLALDTVRTTSGSINALEEYVYFAATNGANGQLTATDGTIIEYEMQLSANNIFGAANNGCYLTSFLDGNATPYIVASQAQRDGNDGGWVQRCSVDTTSVGLHIDEDVNGGRTHTTPEMASIFVFSGAFEADLNFVDHYAISHSGSAVTCEAEAIAVIAHNSVDEASPTGGATIRITATSSTSGWLETDVTWGLKFGAGVFSTPSAGVAEYAFDTAETSMELWLSNTSVADIDINIVDVTNAAITDKDDGGVEDLPLSFRDSGLRFYADTNNDGNADVDASGDLLPIQSPLVAGDVSQQMILRAVETSTETQACVARVAGNQSVNMAYECVNSGTCVRDKDLEISGTAIEENNLANIVDYIPVSLSFDAEGEAPFTVRYFDAGEIRLHAQLTLPAILETATDPAEPEVTLDGSSTGTVVMPADLRITEVKTTVNSSSAAVVNPGTTTTGSGFASAGEPFTVVVQALGASGVVTPNFGQESSAEGITLTTTGLVMPIGGTNPALSSESAFVATSTAGEYQNNAVSWNEVGTITLQAEIADGSYLESGNVVGTESGAVGRFYPKELTLQSSTVTNGCSSGGFTYMSDSSLTYLPVSVGYTVNAITAQGSVASNYDTDLGYPVSRFRYVLENNNDGVDLSSRMFVPLTGSWRAGQWIVDATENSGFSRLATAGGEVVDGPFNSAQLGITVDESDVDGVSFSSSATTQNSETSGDCVAAADCTSVPLGSALNIVFGRLITESVFGPEVTSLPMPFQTEIWDGVEFVQNTADNCTVLSAAAIDFNSGALSSDSNRIQTIGSGSSTGSFSILTSGEVAIANGDAGLSFSAPGMGNTGTVNVDIDLADYPWLRFDWNQDSDNGNDTYVPQSSVTFGSYRGHDRVIFWQEPFN